MGCCRGWEGNQPSALALRTPQKLTVLGGCAPSSGLCPLMGAGSDLRAGRALRCLETTPRGHSLSPQNVPTPNVSRPSQDLNKNLSSRRAKRCVLSPDVRAVEVPSPWGPEKGLGVPGQGWARGLDLIAWPGMVPVGQGDKGHQGRQGRGQGTPATNHDTSGVALAGR